MTVGLKVKQTLAALKGVQSTIAAFAVHEDNHETKNMLTKNAEQINRVIHKYEARTSTIEHEEPEYKGL